jgi:hypothetical protein
MIFIMRLKECMDSVEGEEVARQVECNREWTQIAANFWERDRPGRRGARLATRPRKKEIAGDVFGGTPNTAGETPALPMDRMAEYSRLFASIGGFILNFWKFQKQLMQVVDFQESFSYF